MFNELELKLAIKVINKEIDKVLKILSDERYLIDLDMLRNLVWTRWYLNNELEKLKNGVENNGTTNNFVEL